MKIDGILIRFLFTKWYIDISVLRISGSNSEFILNQGNVGLIFTKGDLKEVREEVAKYKVYL